MNIVSKNDRKIRIIRGLGLRWEDVDFKNRIISVNHNLPDRPVGKEQKVERHIQSPKTDAGTRSIPIVDEVMDRIAAHYETQVALLDKRSEFPKTPDELMEFTRNMLEFTLHDKRVVQARKVITTEQYRDEKTKEYANKYFLYRNEEMFTSIFEAMMERGTIKKCDPKLLAFAYTTPIASLIQLCDRDPDRKDEAMQKMEAFMKMFLDEYRI